MCNSCFETDPLNPAKGNFTDEIGASDLSSVFDSFSVFNVDVMNIYIYILGFSFAKFKTQFQWATGAIFVGEELSGVEMRMRRAGHPESKCSVPSSELSVQGYTGNSAVAQFASAPVKAATRAGAFCRAARPLLLTSLPGAAVALRYFDSLA